MALRAKKDYIKSLQDGREVWVLGEKIPDITTHTLTKIAVEHCANTFDLQQDASERDLFTVVEDGEPISRYYAFPQTSDDLEKRRQLIDRHTEIGRGQLNLTKAIGSDGLMAATVTAHRVKTGGGSDVYSKRLEEYVRHVKKNDLAVVTAMTDVKGDRGKRPHEQADPDMYVRIVERRKDGVVVRGAKAHTSASLAGNDILALPTRAMTEKDADYAVAFSIPANTKGLKLIMRPMPPHDFSTWDNPISSKNLEGESVTVFDDVFVPNERLFLAGEWQAAGLLAQSFANFHRFTGVSYRPTIGDLLVGATQLVAEHNGVAKAPHIRDKVAQLIKYTEMIRACAIAAARYPHTEPPGIAMPNVVYTNVGKHHFADSFYEAVRVMHDVAGGLVTTVPMEVDWNHPEIGPYLKKYLAGNAAVPTEHRVRLMHFIRDLTASDFGGYTMIGTIHGEGPQAAQNIALMADYDVNRCVGLVKKAMGI